MFVLLFVLVLFHSNISGSFENALGEKCNDNCLPSKSQAPKCNNLSGNCIYGCANSWYGKSCSKSCSRACLDRTCFQDSGRCSRGCVAGSYGSKCNKPCWGLCKNNSCFQDSGRCSDGCSSGWYGDKCSKLCKSTCFSKSCIQDSGSCSEGCVIGWYGDKCNKPCSSSCYNRTCLQTSGYCRRGCMQGWYGKMCKMKCVDTCKAHSCDRETLACLEDCYQGNIELYCNTTAGNIVSVSDLNQYIGGVVGVVISLTFVFIIWIVRRLVIKGNGCSSLKFSTSKNTEQSYDDIYNTTEERGSKVYIELEGGYETVPGTSTYELSSNVKANNDSPAATSCNKESGLQTLDGTNVSGMYTKVNKK